MVAVAEAVVDKGTVVVEVLDATPTKHAVEGCLRFYDLVVGAQVNQVEVAIEKLLS